MKRLMMGLVAVLISTAAMAAVDVNSATQAQLEDVGRLQGLLPVMPAEFKVAKLRGFNIRFLDATSLEEAHQLVFGKLWLAQPLNFA